MRAREEAKAAAEQDKANRQAAREQAQVAKQAALEERRAALAAKEAERALRRDLTPQPQPAPLIPPRPPLAYSAARAASLERYRAKRAARHTLEAQKRRRTV